MSDFKFDCPSCGQNIVCDTSNAGMQIPCPVCQNVLTVPKPPAPAAPAVPAAGKLSIRKEAHHAPAQPPPGAANAPAKPTWGAKPDYAAAKRPSGMPKWAVWLIVGLVALGAAGGGYVGWTKYAAKKAAEQAEAERIAQEQAETQRKAQEEAAAKARAAKAAWRLDAAQADFPDREASGKLHGVNFKVETVLFQAGVLTLRQDSGSARQFVIILPIKTGETISGKSFKVAATDTERQPQVTLNWKDEGAKVPGTANFTKGYGMRLEFGAVADGKVPGKIYLSVPDAEQSYVAGHFEIGPRKIAGQPPVAIPQGDMRQRNPRPS